MCFLPPLFLQDTFLRLKDANSGVTLAANDDFCGACSYIEHRVVASTWCAAGHRSRGALVVAAYR